MDTYINQLSEYLFAQSWQIAILTVVIALVTLAMRNKSAHIRYLLWLIVLAKCLVPPLFSVPVAVLPEQPHFEHAIAPVFYEAPSYSPEEIVSNEPIINEERVTPLQEKSKPLSATEVIISAWLAGVILFLIWITSRVIRYTLWLHHRRTPLSPDIYKSFEELFNQFKLKRPPKIWLTKDIAQPFVWGLFRGSIYLPVADSANHKHNNTILAHELSHISRFDAGINALQVAAQAIYWFHPFVWWVNRKIRQEREKCCDEMAVVQLNALPEQYTSAIVETLAAERNSAHHIPSLAIVGSIKDIEERIKTMLRPEKKFYKRPTVTTIVVLLLAALVSIPIGCVLTRRSEKNQSPVVKDFYTGLQRPDGIVCLDKDNLIVVQEAYGPGIGIIKCKRGDAFSTDDVFSGFGSPYNNPDGLIQLPDGRFIVTDGQANTIFEVPKEGGPPRVFLSGIASYTNPAVAPSDFDGPNVDPGDLLIPQWSPASIIAVNPITKEKKNFVDHSFFSPFCEQGVGALEFGPDNKLYMSWSNNPEDKKPPRIYRFDSNGNGEIFLELKDFAYRITDFKIEIDKKNGWLYYVHDPIQPSPYSGQGMIFRISLDKSVNELVCDLGLPCQNIELSPDGKNLYIGIVGRENVIKEIQNVHLLPKYGLKEDAPEISDISPTPKLDDPASWIPRTYGCLIEQTGSKIHIVGTTNMEGWNHDNGVASTKILPEGDFYACVDFMVPKFTGPGNTLVYLCAISTTDNGKRVAILFQPNGIYRIQGWVEDGNSFGGRLRNFGDEDKAYHRMKLKYDAAAKTAFGWIDDKFIGYLNYPMTGPVKFELLANTETKGMQIDLFFDNLSVSSDVSEAPPIPASASLPVAITSGDIEQVKSLISKETDQDNKNAALLEACSAGQLDIVKILIDNGADLEATNSNGGSPLGSSVVGEHFEVAKFLITLGADVNAKNNPGRAILHVACKRGNKEIAALLVENGADVNAKDGTTNDQRPLHWAVTSGNKEIVEMLIANGADVNASDDQGRTPLDFAQQENDSEIIELLLEHGAKMTFWGAITSGNIEQAKSRISEVTDPNARNAALQEACSVGQLEIVKLLIENGADVNARSQRGPALYIATMAGHGEIAELLISKGADVNMKNNAGRAILLFMVAQNNLEMADLLLSNGADIHVKTENNGYTPLHYMASGGNKGGAEYLISKGADIQSENIYHQTPLDVAVYYNHQEVAKLLLDKGADLPSSSLALNTAAKRGHKDMFDLLVSNGADINDAEVITAAIRANQKEMVQYIADKKYIEINPINLAAYHGEMNNVKKYIEDGININVKDVSGFSPLHYAVSGNNMEVVQYLINEGANINSRSPNGQTPICLCFNNIDMASLLISKGAAVDVKTTNGQTLLHWMVNRGNIDMIKLYLEYGADVNAKAFSNSVDWEGWTAFHVACRNGDLEIVKLLIEKGADINAKTDDGDTPASLAEKNGHPGIVSLLLGEPVGMAEIIKSAKTWQPEFEEWYGKPAPDFAITDITGKQHKISDYRGKKLILNFWATWCGPCLREIPDIIKLRNTVSENELAILGISTEKGQTDLVKEFAEKEKMNYTILVSEGKLVPPYSEISAIPTTFIIDPKGNIKIATIGTLSLNDLNNLLNF